LDTLFSLFFAFMIMMVHHVFIYQFDVFFLMYNPSFMVVLFVKSTENKPIKFNLRTNIKKICVIESLQFKIIFYIKMVVFYFF
jgi:hypothetical protein